MRFVELATVSEHVAATTKRGEKTSLLAGLLRSMTPDEAAVAVGLLTGQPRQGRIGVGWSTLSKLDDGRRRRAVARHARDRSLAERPRRASRGRARRRAGATCWPGVLPGDGGRAAAAVGCVQRRAAPGCPRRRDGRGHRPRCRRSRRRGPPRPHVLRATSARPPARRSPAVSTRCARSPSSRDGPSGRCSPRRRTSVAEALAETGEASVEWKLDGARVQAHRRGGDVRLFTRNLNEITDRLPGVVSLVAGLPAGDLVLDGEVAGLTETGGPRRFQDTMGDFSAQAARRSRRRAGGLLLRRHPRRRRRPRGSSRCRRAETCSTSWFRRRSACPRSSRPTPTRLRRSWTTPSAADSKG